MPSEFRFLLICLGMSQRLDDRVVSLSGIVNEVEAAPGVPLELAAVVGLILRPEMQGRALDLMAYSLGSSGERQPIPGYAGTPLILPRGLGPVVLPYEIAVPTPASAIYGFDLFDRDGAFGPPEDLLATYLYSVSVDGAGTEGNPTSEA